MRHTLSSMCRLLLGLVTLAWGASAPAEVYLLKPGVGATGRASVAERLQAREVIREPVTVNGRPGTFTVAVSPLPLAAATTALQPCLKDTQVVTGPSSLLFQGAGPQVERGYLVSTGPNHQTLLFALRGADAPAATPPAPTPAWPDRVLPAPPAARIDTVIEFAGGRLFYGLFDAGAPPPVVLSRYDLRLQDDGWRPVGAAAAGSAVYRHPQRRGLLVVAVTAGQTGTVGTVFLSHDRRLDEVP